MTAVSEESTVVARFFPRRAWGRFLVLQRYALPETIPKHSCWGGTIESAMSGAINPQLSNN
jgi:hypothetical protein